MLVIGSLTELHSHRPRVAGSVFVPTMGALHEGHAALITHAAHIARRRGVESGASASIFVNPTQFNDPADFERYPKTLDADLLICKHAGASVVFAPRLEDIYPLSVTIPQPPLPHVATQPRLEDAHRPGHFAGVCQVVARLFALMHPSAAVFGEKDWQQLQVVREMVAHARALRAAGAMPSSFAAFSPADLDSLANVEIVGFPTQRDRDGLALSSRNRFLSSSDRARSLALSRALRDAGSTNDPARAERIMHEELRQHGLETEYAVVRDAETLLEYQPARSGRALIAAKLGSVRLIDNAPWLPR